ncbi:MAG: flagellar type III secretion system pore protein FliP [Myxococcales bacterium]|nr:flagellar type III secretion system pore protein FliP [Myxococcales bacterium]
MRVIGTIVTGLVLLLALAGPALAQATPAAPALTLPMVAVSGASQPEQISTAVKLLLLITVLAVAPSLLILVTSFTRIVVVLSFLRQALGTNQTPTNQIILGLSMFLTFYIMYPVWQQINEHAVQPYMAQQIGYEEAFTQTLKPLRSFMLHQTREKDLALFIKISRLPKPQNAEEVPTLTIIPAFIVSELKTAFIIGFLIWLPFLIVDMVIASVLMSMGMLMLPPIMISLPFKLMIFVLADGWYLLIGSLVNSFTM